MTSYSELEKSNQIELESNSDNETEIEFKNQEENEEKQKFPRFYKISAIVGLIVVLIFVILVIVRVITKPEKYNIFQKPKKLKFKKAKNCDFDVIGWFSI